ncbi:MAG TPA: class I SAM-dependent methyltransferase [Steroidobacteraceae bacterium]|jgi:SAM-dependent methyltransferase|nr:class I SAM-dependent methyltransferase [Steroidobacteraceae bacterium]
MNTVTDHYSQLLAPVYSWMAGGSESAFDAGKSEVDDLQLQLPAGALVADLGAGFGMHAIPLARAGMRVLAIDSSTELLTELDRLAKGLPVETVADDLLSFRSHLKEKAAAVICLGDTLTHLPEHTHVDFLVQEAHEALGPGGQFALSFRDYSEPLRDEARFIPVRSDERRILTCFLEYEEDTVLVHDILHERAGDAWETRVGSYRKLRLAPERVVASLQTIGFETRVEQGARGMVRVIGKIV